MRVKTQLFWLPKNGNTDDEYEDAFYPDTEKDVIVDRFRCAIADGATETSFARLWANILVKNFVESVDLEKSRASWESHLNKQSLQWYAEQKAADGAFAALCGLSLQEDGSFELTATGDSCAFQIRGGKMILAFPKDEAILFNSRPILICSKSQKNDQIEADLEQGSWENGDQFWLLTDALSRWLLLKEEANLTGVTRLAEVSSQRDFSKFVDRERAIIGNDGRPLLLNDDITMLRLFVESKESEPRTT